MGPRRNGGRRMRMRMMIMIDLCLAFLPYVRLIVSCHVMPCCPMAYAISCQLIVRPIPHGIIIPLSLRFLGPLYNTLAE